MIKLGNHATLYTGNAIEILPTLPPESVNCSMSSPPYYSLRDYGVDGQLGLEETPELFIQHLCDIYDEVKRVLRKDGTCFVNLGDTFGGSGVNDGSVNAGISNAVKRERIEKRPTTSIQPKSLIGIPYRFALEMMNRGWILRNDNIWWKRNCMPSSARDRCTVDYEHVFFFVKSQKYWYEQQFEDKQPCSIEREKYSMENSGKQWKDDPNSMHSPMGRMGINPQGRNMRTVWDIPPRPYPEAHFATYPQQLCERPIAAGCPEFVCVECGQAREKIIETSGGTTGKSWHDHSKDNEMGMHQCPSISGGGETPYKRIDKGYTSCNCGAEFIGGVVLDPFSGSATTGAEAIKQGKRYIGIDISEKYTKEFAVPRLEKAIKEKEFQQQILNLPFQSLL